MSLKNEDFSLEIDKILNSAIPHILGSSIKFVPESEVDRDLGFSSTDYAGVIGIFSDSLRGTLVLSMTSESAQFTNPMGKTAPEDASIIEDWVGEATNLLAGQVRKSLERLHTRMSPPSVEKDPLAVLSRYEDAPHCNRLWFTADSDWICCQFTWSLDDS